MNEYQVFTQLIGQSHVACGLKRRVPV